MMMMMMICEVASLSIMYYIYHEDEGYGCLKAVLLVE